jgi:hypothetical protein
LPDSCLGDLPTIQGDLDAEGGKESPSICSISANVKNSDDFPDFCKYCISEKYLPIKYPPIVLMAVINVCKYTLSPEACRHFLIA